MEIRDEKSYQVLLNRLEELNVQYDERRTKVRNLAHEGKMDEAVREMVDLYGLGREFLGIFRVVDELNGDANVRIGSCIEQLEMEIETDASFIREKLGMVEKIIEEQEGIKD